MKRLTAVLLAMILSMSCITCFAAGNASTMEWAGEYEGYVDSNIRTFKDVPASHWAAANVSRVVASNLMNGYPDGTFRPDASITRAEAMTVIVKFLSYPLTQVETSSFTDVKTTDWYSPYIEAGKDLFPTKNTYGAFQPNMPITREDVIYALVKVKNFEVEFADESVLNMFSDAYSISRIVRPYVAVGVSSGLISGYGNGTIGAQDPLTRAEFATLLWRATYIGQQ